MPFNLIGKSFLSLEDFSKEEINYLIDLSIKIKLDKMSGVFNQRLKNKSVALIFEKTSTRTRCAASVACFDEGGHAEFLGKDDIQMGKKESIKDTARILGRMFNGILFRGYKQETVKTLADYSGVPVINGLTDDEHPTQILADFMTIKEVFGSLKNIKIAYVGDGKNNIANTLLIGSAIMGVDIAVASSEEYFPKKEIIDKALNISNKTGSKVLVTEDVYEAVKGADVVYTDVWVSMGEEDKLGIQEKVESLRKYQINDKVMKSTGKKNSIFLHCLPASHKNEIHNMEVTEDVFESSQSYVFQQGENRLHTIKAILISTIGGQI
ncbi:MAG TPA: ornithine carbamoyltransferase [Spirochaetota bacterium]|nr:ornithine carbamoyltransferase [Spirochaetota bacterium]